jgi:hypothetical protein
MTTSPPPRRKWNITRWLLVFALVAMAWSGWRAYTFRSALSQAKALGWTVRYTDPGDEIWNDWKSAFKKETWSNGVTYLEIPTAELFEQHQAFVHRLEPRFLCIRNAATLRDLSAVKPLRRLTGLQVDGCASLTNLDELMNLGALRSLSLNGSTGLTNVDGLRNLASLKKLSFCSSSDLANLDALSHLTALDDVALNLERHTNLDALKNLTALKSLVLAGCPRLNNLDSIHNLRALESVIFYNCPELKEESVAALRTALPSAIISSRFITIP